MKIDPARLSQRIEHVAIVEAGLTAAIAREVAFHLTDWLDDLEEYRAFATDPAKLTDEEVNELLIRFLIHVPNHLAAARKLFIDMAVTDVFGVGATTESDDDDDVEDNS